MKPQQPYLFNLTPLRGIAALLTVIYHVDIALGFSILLDIKNSFLIEKLYLMVDFFFILSGFILCYVYGQRFNEAVSGAQFKRFAIARFARIYPLHFFVLLYLVLLKVGFLLSGGVEDPLSAINNSWISIPTNLLLIHSMNIHHWFTWNNASWSISTEWWMYMLFPFLVKPVYRLKGAGKITVVAVCVGGYLVIMFWLQRFVHFPPMLSFLKQVWYGTLDVGYEFGFLRCMFGFLIGMVMYQCYTEGLARKTLANGYVMIVLVLALFACMHFALPDVITVAFFPLILLSAAYGNPHMNTFFGTKALQKIGDWSFSIYMVHQPLLTTIGMIMNYINPPKPSTGPPQAKYTMPMGWLVCIAFLALTLLVSYCTYHFIEVPARNRINKKYGDQQYRSA